MAVKTKVNKNFIVSLSIGLLAVFVLVAGTAYYLIRNSPADNAKQGDKFMAAGDFVNAADRYSRAVNKEQTNVEYLEKWRSSLLSLNPDSFDRYQKYFDDLVNVTRQLAITQPGNTEAHQRYIQMRMEMLRGARLDSGGYNAVSTDLTTIIKLNGDKPGPWETIRRYRGMLNAEYYFSSPSVPEKVLTEAIQDMEAALRADPKDGECAVRLASTYFQQAEKARTLLNDTEVARLESKAKEIMAAAAAADPENPYVLLTNISLEFSDVRRKNQGRTLTPQETEKIAQEFVAKVRPWIDRASGTIRAMSPAAPMPLLRQLRASEILVEGIQGAKTEETIRTQFASADGAERRLMLADILSERNDFAQASEVLAGIAEIPQPTLSLNGLRLREFKNNALAQRVIWGTRVWETLPPGAERDAYLAKLKGFREELAKVDSAEEPRLMLVDAYLAVTAQTEEGFRKANQLLENFNRKTDANNIEALFLAAQVAKRINQPGKARDLLGRMVELQPASVGVLMDLAEVETQLANYPRAVEVYRQVLRIAPGNEQARENLEIVEALALGTDVKDPVIQSLLEADRLSKELDSNASLSEAELLAGRKRITDYLKKQFEQSKFDPRMAQALSRSYRRINDKANALAVIEKSLAANPENAGLKTEKRQLTAASPLEFLLQELDERKLPPLDDAITRYSIYKAHLQDAKALEQLANAEKLGPDDKRVIEARFIEHIEAGDLDKARGFADRAAAQNLDAINGDSFKARLLMADGKTEQAATLLKAAVERGGAQPEVYRLYARSLLGSGRVAEGIAQYREALRLRPNDLPTIIDLLSSLQGAGQLDTMLVTARDYRQFAEADPRFIELWLAAESAVGDKILAAMTRERIRSASPENRSNAFQLAELYMQLNEMPRAKNVIDALRKESDGTDAVFLDASWRWRSADREGAKALIEQHIAGLPEAQRNITLHLGTARFYLDRGDAASAIAAIDRARPLQQPKVMEADRSLSDAMARVGNVQGSYEAAKRVVDAGADTEGNFYLKRVVDCLTQLGRAEEAQAALNQLSAKGKPDVLTMLLSAGVADARKDTAGQRDMLNQAVANYPNDPAVFIRRGQFLMRDERTLRDAAADFGRAIELAPGNAQALVLRSQARRLMQDDAGVVEDLRAAVRATPYDNGLLLNTLTELERAGKESEASNLAMEIVQRRPKDSSLAAGVGDFFTRVNRNDIAMDFYRIAFEANPGSDSIALLYLTSLLAGPKPDLAGTERVLGKLGDRVNANAGFLMAKARMRMEQNRTPEAGTLALDSLRKCNASSGVVMQAWYTQLKDMIPDATRRTTFLEGAQKQGIAPDWTTFFRGYALLDDNAKRDEGLKLIEQAGNTTKTPDLKLAACKVRGNTYYNAKDYLKAADAWRQGLADAPQDVELLNNLAYTLAKHLNQTDEALTLAARIAELAPEAPDALDTLGTVYFKAGRVKEAVAKFEQAFARAGNPFGSGVHLVEALLADGNSVRAKEVVAILDEIVRKEPAASNPQDAALLQELRSKLGV